MCNSVSMLTLSAPTGWNMQHMGHNICSVLYLRKVGSIYKIRAEKETFAGLWIQLLDDRAPISVGTVNQWFGGTTKCWNTPGFSPLTASIHPGCFIIIHTHNNSSMWWKLDDIFILNYFISLWAQHWMKTSMTHLWFHCTQTLHLLFCPMATWFQSVISKLICTYCLCLSTFVHWCLCHLDRCWNIKPPWGQCTRNSTTSLWRKLH